MSIIRTHYNRCNWLGRISILLIITWLLITVIFLSYFFKSNTINLSNSDNNFKQNVEKLMEISNDFEILKKQNKALRNLISKNGFKTIQENHFKSVTDNILENSIDYSVLEQKDVLSNNFNQPSLQYEEIRRQIRSDIQEMGYFINEKLDKIKKNVDKYNLNNEITEILHNFNEYKKALIINIEKLSDNDGYSKWREKEAIEISKLVQQRFRYLQNPFSCNTARKLICNLNKGCGFGCQIHHLVYCFLVAYGTERTLILKSKGWRYQKDGWESVFKPLSDTCLSVNGKSHANWPGDREKQVLTLPIVDNVYPKPIYQPPSVPADLVDRLKKIHGYPLVWWVGQVLKYLMRPNNKTKNLLEIKKFNIKFRNPIVGVHIRRTDKVGTEAAFHDIDEYMNKVQQYFENLEVEEGIKRVFLASDDPNVIMSAKQRYPEYDIIADIDIAQTASITRRYSNLSLQGIIIDIHLLSLCDFLVCTFSSQVCRVAYELMQTRSPDAYNKFASLDDIYYYGGQNPHPQIVIANHIPRKEGEIEMRINDQIEVYGNHWDGYSKGRNLRTGISGLFPSFKIKSIVNSVNFPKYENISVK